MEMQKNQIFNMDCVKLMEQLPDGAVSMILTDPPYGIAYQNSYTHRKHQKLKGDEGIDYLNFAKESFRILENNAHAYFFTRYDCYPYHYECLKKAGFQIKNCMIVEKGNIGGIGDLKGSYANNAEWLIFCQKGRRRFNETKLMENKQRGELQNKVHAKPAKRFKTRFNACWFGAEYPKATYNLTWQKKHHIYHPTIKNVELLVWLIQISSHPGELVFDGFIGTGSTALAAIKTGRDYLGADIEQKYVQIARRRILEQIKQQEAE